MGQSCVEWCGQSPGNYVDHNRSQKLPLNSPLRWQCDGKSLWANQASCKINHHVQPALLIAFWTHVKFFNINQGNHIYQTSPAKNIWSKDYIIHIAELKTSASPIILNGLIPLQTAVMMGPKPNFLLAPQHCWRSCLWQQASDWESSHTRYCMPNGYHGYRHSRNKHLENVINFKEPYTTTQCRRSGRQKGFCLLFSAKTHGTPPLLLCLENQTTRSPTCSFRLYLFEKLTSISDDDVKPWTAPMTPNAARGHRTPWPAQLSYPSKQAMRCIEQTPSCKPRSKGLRQEDKTLVVQAPCMLLWPRGISTYFAHTAVTPLRTNTGSQRSIPPALFFNSDIAVW